MPPQYLTAELPETAIPSELHNSQILNEISSDEIGHYEMSTLSSPTQHPSNTGRGEENSDQTYRWLVC